MEREVRLHCTGKPDLIAREMTERLVKDRYKMRIEKKQSLEDSMMQCKLRGVTIYIYVRIHYIIATDDNYLRFRGQNPTC